MNSFRINIWDKEEYSYQAAYGFIPNIKTYIHDDDEERDCVMVVPGGGYCMVVPPEGEIVAKKFYDMGMNTFVLTYTTDITFSIPLKKQPLADISRAVRVLRKNAAEFKINPNRVFICGFSAGGHVCGSLCTHFDEIPETNEKYLKISDKPDGAMLCYPVITTGKYTHEYSVAALLGNEPSEEELEYFSLEKNVKENMPPIFMWQTLEDDLVPVENTYLFAQSLKDKNVPFAQYVFPKGRHGLSVATLDFFKGEFGEPFTMEQVFAAVESVKNHQGINVSQKREEELRAQFSGEPQAFEMPDPEVEAETYKDVSMWTDLAYSWMKKL